MAIKVFQHFLCICLFSLALPQPSHAIQSKPKAENPTSFDFIKHLEGGRKGQTVKGLQQLKTYLQEFGYINYSPNQTRANDDDFDDSLEAAVKKYQLNYHLKTTGTLDAQTVSQMMAPRCGFPDISNGTNWMRASKNEASHTQNTIHTVSHFAFFTGNPKWPPTMYRLTYAFAPGTRADAKSAVARAFDTWASESPFTFFHIQDFTSADLNIGFYRGDHGDGAPFSPNGLVAHAFPPTDGRFHYNADYSFSEDPVAGSFHLETVALHEIGHLLGLGHSSVQEAIMYPIVPAGTTRGLHADDIQGIKTLYEYLESSIFSSFVIQCDV